jgi:hypothetical protein
MLKKRGMLKGKMAGNEILRMTTDKVESPG